ncbi:MAG: hypothetical protein K1X78_10405 [Verrucomicrobiaceae bacterium]|nr:hypothetical protein [Verrucomicrobiaceae bacterium]
MTAAVTRSPKDASEIIGFFVTAFKEWWATTDYDSELRRTLTVLSMTKADAFVVKIAGRCELSYCRPHSKHSRTLLELKEALRHLTENPGLASLRGDDQRRPLNETHRYSVTCVPVKIANSSHCYLPVAGKPDAGNDVNYCAYAYPATLVCDGRESDEENFARMYAHTIGLVLFDLFRNREHRFAALPKEISKRYWDDSDPKTASNVRLTPPWDRKNEKAALASRRTATLSLDLRRSTFCMEQADQGQLFGDWLEQLVKLLTAVTHRNGGVFDKFTGDGALVHFLELECEVVYQTKPVSAAVKCAIEMQEAISIHLRRLREFLHFDSAKLGAGVAIDLNEAYWTIDGGDSPIVVGRGVVGACRACGSAPAGAVRLSNIAYRELCPEIANHLAPIIHEVPLITKEWSEAMGVQVWEFVAPSSWPPSEIADLCQAIYDDRLAYSLAR